MAKKRKRAIRRKPSQSAFIVYYKVSIFVALVFVVGALLVAVLSPLVVSSVSVLGAFTGR